MPDNRNHSETRELRALVRSAILAPSSHNTQPWRFSVREGRIALYADRTRALPANDPDDRELTISCGCALMNLRVAAAAGGLGPRIKILPELEDPDLLAYVELAPSTDRASDDAQLFPAITKRRTYRKRYEAKPVLGEVLDELAESAHSEGAWVEVLSGETTRHKAAELIAEGDAIQWADPSWRRELAAWMHPRRQGDGLVVPGLAAPIAQLTVRSFDMGSGVAAKDRKLANESPVLAVLGSERDDAADWVSAGQSLQRLLLTACQKGLQASYLNQPIQVPSLRPKLKNLLSRGGFPQILFRLGFPGNELPATSRRELDQVID